MKQYVKPALELISLTSEERFAVTSTRCTVTGCCPDSEIQKFQEIAHVTVNYSAGF